MNTSQIAPVENPRLEVLAAEDRIIALDIVRGVAVLGIVVPNIIGFGQPQIAYTWPGGFLGPPGPFSDWLWSAQLVLVDGKFRALFTMLFGAGMVLFYRRAVAKGAGYGLLARRLGWLAVFGFAHWALLWRGDILTVYAAGGVVALAAVGWRWTQQLALGVAGYIVGAMMAIGATVPSAYLAEAATGGGPAIMRQALADQMAHARDETALIVAGDYLGTIRHTLSDHLASLPFETLWVLIETVPLMLIGMGMLTAGLFDGRIALPVQRSRGWALWLFGIATTVPIALWALEGGLGYWESFAAVFGWATLPNLASAAGLLALLALWGQHAGGALAERVAAAGQCAFTNYIGTSVLALVVFSGWGLGLFGKLGRLELYGVMLLFWVVMLAWPRWWLARFRHGPLEWLWRSLTYWKRVPLRR